MIETEKIGIEFNLDLKDKKKTEKTRFYRELYGYKDSKRGYTYVKEGLLSTIPNFRPSKSSIICKTIHRISLRSLLIKNSIKFSERIVLLSNEEAGKLGMKFSKEWPKEYEKIKGSKKITISTELGFSNRI